MALCEPDTGEVRYVGKTVGLKARLKIHRKEKGQTRKCRWIRTLKDKELLPIVKILQVVEDSDWEEAETSWIRLYRDFGADLTNHADGGQGVHNPDEETRSRYAASMRRRMADPEYVARVFTPEWRKNVSKGLTGRYCPKKLKPKNCKGCGVLFQPAEMKRVYCTKECYWRNLISKNPTRQTLIVRKFRGGLYEERLKRSQLNEPQVLSESSASNSKSSSVPAARRKTV